MEKNNLKKQKNANKLSGMQ